MASSSEFWIDGSLKWKLSHEGEDGPVGLEEVGQCPPEFSAIRSKYEKLQADEGGDSAEVDYMFEIPLMAAKAITGFKHDEEMTEHLSPFRVLKRTNEKRGFFSRIFSK
jgi:hypothetical protein